MKTEREDPSVRQFKSKDFPIWGAQWHAERTVFEFNSQDTGLNKTFDAEYANLAVAQFFVNQTRYSNHNANNQSFLKQNLIYKYVPTYLGESDVVYFF